jgi:oligoribonuclease NrnB/cAMP/cGMP phosphodiesterase (DHH superfamily)
MYLDFKHEGKNFFYAREYKDGVERTSATMMMFRYFMQDNMKEHSDHMDVISLPGWISLYNFADAISRYDTWNWREHPSDIYDGKEDIYTKLLTIYPIYKLTGIILNNLKPAFEYIKMNGDADEYTYNDIMKAIDSVKKIAVDDDTMSSLAAIETLYNRSLGNIESKVRVTVDDNGRVVGHVIPDFNLFTSNLCNDILNMLPKLDYLILYYPESCMLSFRTNRDDVDVSVIAESMNGGGHAKAAGCTCSRESFYSVLKNYYYAPTYKEYCML